MFQARRAEVTRVVVVDLPPIRESASGWICLETLTVETLLATLRHEAGTSDRCAAGDAWSTSGL